MKIAGLLNTWDKLRTSYWFVPSVFIVLAIFLSLLLPYIDGKIVGQFWDLPSWLIITNDTAKVVLSGVSASILTVTGTIFSITIVTLSLTSQQFGPRLLRRFMYDLTTQITLGFYIGTSSYSLLVLRVLGRKESLDFTPNLTVFVSMVLTVICMVILVLFIHNISTLVQAPNIVHGVYEDLCNSIKRIFPEKVMSCETKAVCLTTHGCEKSVSIVAHKIGYFQGLEVNSLQDFAERYHLVLEIQPKVGEFISGNTEILVAWCETEDFEFTEEMSDYLGSLFLIGIKRTPRQDVGCAINELVEVAVRSLSPGINDPFTAVSCVDYLSAAMELLISRGDTKTHYFDSTGNLRIVFTGYSFQELIDLVFDQIRYYGQNSYIVVESMLRALNTLESMADTEEMLQILNKKMASTRLGIKNFSSYNERKKLYAI